MYALLQLSCVSSSAALANRIRYPSYFQLLAPDADLANGFLAIIKQFEWRRVALIVQEENLLTVVKFLIVVINDATIIELRTNYCLIY